MIDNDELSDMKLSHQRHVSRQQSPKSTGRIIVIVLAVLLAFITAYGCVLSYKAIQTKNHVEKVVDLVRTSGISSDLNGSVNKISEIAPQLQQESQAARSQTDSITWRIGELLPYVGDDLSATRTAVTALDKVTSDVLPNMMDAVQDSLSQGWSSDGSVNITAVLKTITNIENANTVMQEQKAALVSAPTPHIEKVRKALITGVDIFNKIAEQTDSLTKVMSMFTQLVSSGNGKYLIMVQSNAETRAAGGVPGSVGSIDVKSGKITIGEFHSDSEFQLGSPVDGNEQVEGMYLISQFGVSYGSDIRLATVSPDFTVAAKYAAGVWKQQSFGASDNIKGVMSFDPYALQKLLGVLGDIKLSNGVTLNGNNTAEYLSNTVYKSIRDPNKQDQFFKEAAETIMNKIFNTLKSSNLMQLGTTLAALGQQRHIYMTTLEQNDGTNTEKSWDGSISSDPLQPETGFYVNEMNWTKMDWYAQRTSTITKTQTNADGSATYHVKVTVANTLDPSQVSSLPAYITATFPTQLFQGLIDQSDISAEQKGLVQAAISKAQPGVLWHVYYLAAPTGGDIANIKVSNSSASEMPEAEQFTKIIVGNRTYYNNVGTFIDPGATATIEYDVTTAPGAASLQFDQTPVAGEPKITYTN